MKKKYTITFTVDASYPYIDSADKHVKKMSRDFDQYLKEWAMNQEHIVPVLFEPHPSGAIDHDANATVRVKVKRDKEVILDSWFDILSKDF